MRRLRRGGVLLRPAWLAGFAFLCTPSPAGAWDKDGHEAIGMTAMSAMETQAVAHVKRLMHGKDAVDVAGWAHKVNKKYSWTTSLHFQPQPSPAEGAKCKGVDLTRCPDNKCLQRALRHFYGRLVNKSLAEIDWGAGVQLTDADCIKYLINLIGDMHQPLHYGREADNMGRNLSVVYRGKTTSLFDFWDREIAQTVIRDSPGFWWSGWTHVQRTRVEYDKDGGEWKKNGPVMFDRWADETARYACEGIYRNPLRDAPLAEGAKDGVIQIDAGLFELWKREMLSRMLVAGARTAIVLNAVLQHRELGSLRGGSAVSGIEGEEEDQEQARIRPPAAGRKADPAHMVHGMHPTHGATAGLINLGIFVVVILIFLQVMRMWHNMDPVTQADKAKRMDTGKKI